VHIFVYSHMMGMMMSNVKIIVVEDNIDDISVFKDAVKRFEAENDLKLECDICKSTTEAFEKLDSSYDGAIIDIALGELHTDGNDVVKKLLKQNARIPIAIYTGTPDGSEYKQSNITTYKKGDPDVLSNILTNFADIYKTGLTKIMGTRGRIETALDDVFVNNIFPQIDVWVEHGKEDSQKTETALLRHTLNNLLQALSYETELSFPDEFYLPALPGQTLNGDILNEKETGNFYVVLNPSCDLVLRPSKKPGEPDKPKTDHYLLVLIEKKHLVLNEQKKRNNLKSYLNNNIPNYHWAPKTLQFQGGFISFQQIKTVPINNLRNDFDDAVLQISPSFMKDVSARFSMYYGRQGQPDMKIDGRVDSIMKSLPELT
jgi:CheY-like chemotaxis protein